MYKYEIEGGFPIKGSVRASGNKNAALPCIAATLLTAEPVVLRNIPDIEDVLVMFDISCASWAPAWSGWAPTTGRWTPRA